MIAVYNEFTDELDIHSAINIITKSDTIPLTDSFVKKILPEKEILPRYFTMGQHIPIVCRVLMFINRIFIRTDSHRSFTTLNTVNRLQ